ncbi:predicted protein [Pyrenophora tritici-repentis Pt-1C-BFP]|uniref:Uncharacterized protein n=1 Tax=Pyrenophora tritici-repentis (strain Pt-1C-BFP) TaxID=426418 RepID=B2W3L7_PYRTR|nr:uncharacterized protein PTRG_05067 [Pyrenophora tritici-repentis Pt-1C-BFP]EDU47974.1 predicted protein [Pyrenophora tritici-repentis Pt-1C-BFP]
MAFSCRIFPITRHAFIFLGLDLIAGDDTDRFSHRCSVVFALCGSFCHIGKGVQHEARDTARGAGKASTLDIRQSDLAQAQGWDRPFDADGFQVSPLNSPTGRRSGWAS